MKKLLLCLLGAILLLSGCASLSTRTTESGIQIIPSFDEYPIEGMLAMPEGKQLKHWSFCQWLGSEYLRQQRRLMRIGNSRISTYFGKVYEARIAFFSYNTRGVT